MRKAFCAFLILSVFVVQSCKKKEIDPEPAYILQKWARSIENFDYKGYVSCEAYPKSEAVFREMYREEYYRDITAMETGVPKKQKVREDYNGNSYIERNVSFEGAVIKRGKKEPYQIVRGDVVFVKFTDGERNKDGWLLSNRTITRINR